MEKGATRVILASLSPARRALMKGLDIPFECHASGYEEDMNAYKTPRALAKFLATQKATFIAHQYKNAIIIGADTFGTMGNKKLGKPHSITAAREMIRSFRNNKIKVHTGLATIQTNQNATIIKELATHTVTTLTFGDISEKEINSIIEKDDVLNTAGALTIEGESGKFVKTIDGDYHNVIGLPLFQLKDMLRNFEIHI